MAGPFYVTVTGSTPGIPSIAPSPMVAFTAAGWVPDPAASMLFPPNPQYARIFEGAFSAVLLATDTTDEDWTWEAEFTGIPGVQPYSFSFALPSQAAAFTATDAAPCVFTAAGTSYADGQPLTLAAGSLPGGFATSTVYYVVSASGDAFSLAVASGGAALASTSTGSGWAVPVVDISALAAIPSVPPMVQYTPLPQGAAALNDVPTVTQESPLTLEWGPPGGSGTVTQVGVESANGFAGTVADETTTPQITLTTTVTGLLKGNGTAVSAAAAGTDYLAPSGSGAALTGITVSQVSGAAPLASPALTGTPTAPTASALADSTQVATTAYADSAVSVETTRAETAEALKAPLASPALTGSPTAPTQTTGDNSTKIATDAFVTAAVAAETSRAEAAEALLAPKASPALTGTPTAPTASALTGSTQIATTAYTDSAVAAETSRAETAEALKAPLASPALTGTPTAPTATAGTDTTQLATTAYAYAAAQAAQSAAESASDPLGSAAAVQGAAYPDQLPALSHGLTATTGITGLLAAIANCASSPVVIPVIGDSATEGQHATAFGNIYVQRANDAIRRANGVTGGLGFIPITSTGETSYTWPVTLASGSAGEALDLGPVRNCAGMTAAGSFTFTAPSGTTSVKIMYYDAAFAGEFSYRVNSGATTDVSNTETLADLLTSSITITGGETLTITWVSGTVVLDGIIHYAGDEASGVAFYECGHYGWDSSATAPNGWNQPEYIASLNWIQAYAAWNPSALAICLLNNDAVRVNAATFQADLQAFVTALRSNAILSQTLPLILILQQSVFTPVVDPGGWPAYVAAFRAVAAANANTLVVDWNFRVPDLASDFEGGILYNDVDDHPTDLGHALMGAILAAGVGVA